MRAETLACRAAAVGFCVLLTAAAPVFAQPPPAEFDARWGSPDHTPFLPVISAELKGRD